MTNQRPMTYCRYTDGNETQYGVINGDTIEQLNGFYVTGGERTGRTIPRDAVQLTLPVDKAHVGKVIGVHGNYQVPGTHPRRQKHPAFFPKFHTSLITNGEAIELPAECQDPHPGVSLVVLIGRRGRNLSLEEASDVIFGVTVGNDVTDGKAFTRTGGLFTPDRMLGKANDTWGPIGQTVVSGLDWRDLRLTSSINGKLAQDGRTSQMINSVERLIHYCSTYITLEPGDLLFTGSPSFLPGMRTIRPGDQIEVTLEGIGSLSNGCVALQGIDAPWWLETFATAAALPENADDVAAAAGPMASYS